MTVNTHRCSSLIFFQSLFSGFNYFKNPHFNRPLFFNQSFPPILKRRFNIAEWLQVQRRQIFCPHPWRAVDSLPALPRPYANRANSSSCWLHSPGDKHKLSLAAAPASIPSIPTPGWMEITIPETSLQPWQVTVTEMLCWGCSSANLSSKMCRKCVWALPQQTGTVLGWQCQAAAH